LTDGQSSSGGSSSKDSPGHPLLIILSGPSGVGKDAVLSRMRLLDRPFHLTVTVTTRPKRPMETDGIDYIFMSEKQFRLMVLKDEFLEHAEVYGNHYGVPKQQVRDAMAAGLDVIIKADVQGAQTIRALAPEAVAIFLAPTEMSELEDRLTARLTETPGALALRLQTAAAEMEESQKFDYVVYNPDGRLDEAVVAIERLVRLEKDRVPPRRVTL
jgi:guanylate kinase